MKQLLLSFLSLTFFAFCSHKPEQVNEDEKADEAILGIWTDGSGPNASIRIDKDSIFNVEHLEKTKYKLTGDSLIIFYENEPFKAKVIKIDADSLIYISEYGETVMWRFKD